MGTIDLSKVQGNATAILNIRVNFSAAPEGKVKANVAVERNTYNMAGNPQTESATQGYNYEGTAEEVIAAIDTDLNLGIYLANTQGV